MDLETLFPGLTDCEYHVISDPDPKYNCIAWAAGDSKNWWEPDPLGIYYWPEGAQRSYTLSAYAQAFQTLGYADCDSREYEPDSDRVALFVDSGGFPTHAARQRSEALWTSKLGRLQDIVHELDGLAGQAYGSVAQVLRRPRSPVAAKS